MTRRQEGLAGGGKGRDGGEEAWRAVRRRDEGEKGGKEAGSSGRRREGW